MSQRDQCLQRLLTAADIAWTVDNATKWWQDRRDSGGLRLSAWAYQQLANSTAESWKFDLDPTWITPRNMLRMDRLIPVPYSVITEVRPRRSGVVIWESQQAMTIELMGDFDRFLVSLERAWSRTAIGKS